MSTLTTLAMFDDLRRCQEVLIDGAAEEEFLKFVQLHEQFRLHWLYTLQESQRLQRELDASLRNMADLETKLFHARRLLEMENKSRKEAEHEREQIEKKMMALRDLLRNDADIREETRDKFAFLDHFPKKRKSGTRVQCDEINSTGSFLSDLSLTQSEDDFLDVKPSKVWKKHRPSRPGNTGTYVCGRKSRVSSEEIRRSVNKNAVEIGMSDKIVAKTKVSIPAPGDGPITAESTIQAIPQKTVDVRKDEIRMSPKRKSIPKTMFTPTAPPMQENVCKATPTYDFKKSIMREHNFASKTFIASDTCVYCQKKIRFGSVGLKCRDCRTCVHPNCRENLTVACVPQGSGTPTVKGVMGIIEDYAPATTPRVPGLIVHCVTEIETRGLGEVGIYRVSGSEREVKALKEKFLRGKGIPYLGNIDIHVLAGCIKDFLRSLREPLIPTDLWRDFSNAVQNLNPEKIMFDLHKAIDKLPQTNRDTLAFLIQHFQRIALCPEIKMPLENIARVFGPTIVGFSSLDPDGHAILTETTIQYNVISNLMKIPTEYWHKYVNCEIHRPELEKEESLAKPHYATPLRTPMKKIRKFYGTPPYPLKKH